MKTVNTKKELCEFITQVLQADSDLKKEDLLQGLTIEAVYENVMKSIHFRRNGNPALEKVYETYGKQFESIKYEMLMRWVQNDMRDLTSKEDRGNYDIGMTIMNLDIYCVVKNHAESIAFIQDLEKRINRVGYFLEPTSEQKFRKSLVKIFKNELSEWESKFIKSVMKFKWSKLSEKQKATYNKIVAKYGN